MNSLATIDWAAYNASAAGRPARRIVTRAILAAGGEGSGKVALDIGAGAGADSLEFARRGWTVHAYDIDETLSHRLIENRRMSGEVVFHHADASLEDSFPRADVIYSSDALPMLGPEGLERAWPRLVDALRPGGIMAVDLFGEQDTWAERPDVATLSTAQISSMFSRFQILEREVRDEDGRFFDGKKHWHVITTLARKRA
ncbi:class I SAM-dependent methyltransferase [Brachybacterium phenoliresistens]|uniref:Methyltransferase n=1 Tax=Brachybacterium phenoliresistens TaxID=396014 RepID=Z9JS56_9MICO|nr:class I SAM-dependent methyltransferase [Brachybacterium phenoliresistens]EWS80641.1 methyltransferase [Brachybacterium phenoliresistens]